MRTADTLRYEMLTRVREFGAAHTAEFPAASLGGQLFAEVGETVTELDRHTATEVSGRGAARGSTDSKSVARQALRDQIEAIANTAKALAIETPGIDARFRVPRTKGDQGLLSTARAIATDAAPLVKEFVAHAMPADFLDTLARAVTRFEESMNAHTAGKSARIAARASITTAIETGFTAVRKLDPIVENTFREDPSTTTLWQRIRHVERLPRTKEGDAEGDSAPAANATPPPRPANSPAAPAATPAAPAAATALSVPSDAKVA